MSRHIAKAEERAQQMALQEEFVIRPLLYRTLPQASSPFSRVLVTAPHSAVDRSVRDGQRDPLSEAFAKTISSRLARAGARSTLLVASKHRRVGDQNRMRGLIEAGDLAFDLATYRKAHMERETILHLDVHSYTQGAPLPGWGRGINIVVHANDREQIEFARRFAVEVDATAGNAFGHPSRVVVMRRAPVSVDDDDSNALIDWSRTNFRGNSLLLEFPVKRRSGCPHSSDDSSWRVAGGFEGAAAAVGAVALAHVVRRDRSVAATGSAE